MSRSVADLEAKAVKFWPAELAEQEQSTSIIPRLIESQEKFIGILYVANASPLAWKNVLQATKGMPANLFLKHLSVLSDVGGEKFQRYRREIDTWFPEGKMPFRWGDADHEYAFQSLGTARAWTNKVLGIDGAGLSGDRALSAVMEDVAVILLHGGSSLAPRLPDDLTEKCLLGGLIGRKAELDSFVRQRYIHVSRITGGATANTMGQLCQQYVREALKQSLSSWDFSRHTIPGISQNRGRTDMSFDIVGKSPKGVYCAIEVSFQVTTNSTIERKAGQAADRQRLLREKGHRIAYVIDGAGNFQRRSALSTICSHSDCTVAFGNQELAKLVAFLRSLG